jgi:hypothetical protein
MQIRRVRFETGLATAGILAALGSCSSNSSLKLTCASSSTCPASAPSSPGGSSAALRPFSSPTDPGAGGVLFAASGEVLAFTGYAFPPATPDDAAFVDGWDVHFTRLLVTVDNITMSQGPNIKPGDQSCVEPIVAKVAGPWAVDLSHSDPSYLEGKGGPGEKAVPIAALTRQNYPDGNSASFDTSGATPYAFGFDIATASGSAMNVNLDAAGLADYQTMIDDGCAVLYVGTATFKGTACTCPTTVLATATCDPATYGNGNWPTAGQSVPFHLCFKSPTTYVNCQNPDNDPATAFAGEEHQRGVYFKKNSSVIAQVTLHTDHPFWDSVLHDSPAHFDQYAAGVAGMAQNGIFPKATVEFTKAVDYKGYSDALGHALNWRYCIAPPTDVHPQLVGPMVFDAQSVPRTAGMDGCTGLHDYYDFAT